MRKKDVYIAEDCRVPEFFMLPPMYLEAFCFRMVHPSVCVCACMLCSCLVGGIL